MRSLLILLAMFPMAAAAQAVDLSGTILNPSGQPVTGARVLLPSLSLADTTDAAGKYRLVRVQTGLSGTPGALALSAEVRGESLELRLAVSGKVRVEAFEISGRSLGAVYEATLPAGGWRVNPFAALATRGAAVIRLSLGDESRSFLMAPPSVSSSRPLLSATPRHPAAAAKTVAAPETLVVVAAGFQREERGVEALSGTQDFRLKALGYSNVAYKKGPGLSAYEIERCKLDVHAPAGSTKKWPVYLHFHGGGLHGGDKNEGWFAGDNWFSRKLMEEGLLIFSPNYRLGYDPDLPRTGVRGKYPDYLVDAAAAVNWVWKNMETYGGDPDRFFVGGFSAGAWLAAMLALDTSYYQAHKFETSRVKGYVSFSVQAYTYGQVAWERGVSDRSVSDASLMGHVRKHDIPMHIFLGGYETDRLAENQAWVQKMRDAGSTHFFFSVQAGRDHKQLVTTMGNAVDDTRAKMMDFIRRYSPAP